MGGKSGGAVPAPAGVLVALMDLVLVRAPSVTLPGSCMGWCTPSCHSAPPPTIEAS